MQTFEFIRPADAAAAVASAAQANTAQRGADVRFVAGGTTLLDLPCSHQATSSRTSPSHRPSRGVGRSI